MGIFDKAESEAEDMAQKDPNLAQQAQQFGGGQGGQGHADRAEHGRPAGRPQDRFGDQNMGGGYQDQNMGGQGMDSNQNMDPASMGPGPEHGSEPAGRQDQNHGRARTRAWVQDQNMDPDQNQGQNQNPELVATIGSGARQHAAGRLLFPLPSFRAAPALSTVGHCAIFWACLSR